MYFTLPVGFSLGSPEVRRAGQAVWECGPSGQKVNGHCKESKQSQGPFLYWQPSQTSAPWSHGSIWGTWSSTSLKWEFESNYRSCSFLCVPVHQCWRVTVSTLCKAKCQVVALGILWQWSCGWKWANTGQGRGWNLETEPSRTQCPQCQRDVLSSCNQRTETLEQPIESEKGWRQKT